ncbi:N-acetyltransferase [Mesorhizobium sp. LHD-90]|uniref:GNAT family N-acetyltransferase n=1 Tax=Mesorhizobium sp. LHD-90 TaxID=3071414 RepID=UPI0027DF55D0|nr:N-acetyltransferase [Mesorhizobium sp. LHD-90]MDQ6435725.1 N-acetyltransferase [Mesorhizobium sp. LHD-90]
MSGFIVRPATEGDRDAIHALVERAFGQKLEADLVDRLVADGAAILELVAERDGRIVGHVLFSRLIVERDSSSFAAVALAPLGVDPAAQRQGIGAALVEEAHRRLEAAGEKLSVVLGDPAYYGRFDYRRSLAAGFSSDYQHEALQALAWGDAPTTGRLVYPLAFAEL